MAKKLIKCPSMSRVTVNSTAILELPVGPTYHNIVFSASGTALALSHFGGVRVLANGNEIHRYKDVQRLVDLNFYYNRSVDSATEFMLHFMRHEFADLAAERAPALGTGDLRTLTIEIDILAGAPANIAMSATAFIDTVSMPIGVFHRIRETSLTVGGAGEFDFDKLQKGNKVYQAIHFFKSDVTAVRLEVDGVNVVDSTKAVLERMQKTSRPVARVPVTAKATTLDFNIEGDAGDMLSAMNLQDIRAKITVGSAGTVEIVTEELATLDNYV